MVAPKNPDHVIGSLVKKPKRRPMVQWRCGQRLVILSEEDYVKLKLRSRRTTGMPAW